MQKEIDILKREIEMLKMQSNLGTSQAASDMPSSSVTHSFTFKDIEESLPVFSGRETERVENWLQDFEQSAEILQWSDLQKLVYAKRSLKGTAKLALRAASNLTTWSALKEFLEKEFSVKTNSAEIHAELARRRKTATESYHDYFLSIRELGKSGGLEDEAIIAYAINGIPDDANKIILYGTKTLGEFKEKLEIFSKIATKSKPNNFPKAGLASHRTRDENKINKDTPRCFNCGKLGHLGKFCDSRRFGIKCFRCNEYGHKSNACTSSKECFNKPARKEIAFVQEVPKVRSEMCKDIKINGLVVEAFIDTGSDLSFIREDSLKALGRPKLEGITFFKGVGSRFIQTLGSFIANIEVDGHSYQEKFHVASVDNFPKKFILGKTFLNRIDLSINPDEIRISPTQRKDYIFCLNVESSDEDEIDVEHLNGTPYGDDILSLYRSYDSQKATKVTDIELRIILKNEAPIHQTPRRLSRTEMEVVQQQIEEWEKNGIVQPSNSDFASPIVLVQKKDGGKRICVDYRRLNKEIIKDRYPLPLVEDLVDQLSNAKIFTTLDLQNGFFHVPVAKESRKYTAFVTPMGHYEFLKTPFGLCNSPAIFQRFINRIFQPFLRAREILLFIDDIIIPSETEEENIEVLRKILSVAQEYGLNIKWTKCQFLRSKVQYLGYEIEHGTIKPSKEKTAAVSRFPEPKTVKQLQSFLGLTGYFRKFVPQYSLLAKPLSDVLRDRKDSKLSFDASQRLSFERLKNILCGRPVLAIYKSNVETEVHTDACKYGFGAILLQRNEEDNQMHPVYYFSRKTSPVQEKMSSYELETLAVVLALRKFRVYLLGIQFKIITDCSSFKATMDKKEVSPKVARWALELEEFNYEVVHRAGSAMRHADALSRNPLILLVQNDVIHQVQAAQQKDDGLKAIMEVLTSSEFEDYMLEQGVLFKECRGQKLLVVLKGMQAEIIRRVHELGHFGQRKMEELIQREYYIPKLADKISSCIRNCISCILSSKEGKREGFLHPIEKGTYPFDTFHVDHLGPMRRTAKQYKYILTVIDAFSKFVWLFPTKTTSADEVVKKLEFLHDIFGYPRRIISDRGAAFTSGSFNEFCKNGNIEHVLITTGIARGNGQVERMHRVIISSLSRLASDNPDTWFKYLGQLQRCLNNSYHRSIDRTPFELMTGVKMKCTDDILLAEVLKTELMEAFNGERDQMREEAKEQIKKIQSENCRSFNRRRKAPSIYKRGDLVAIRRTQFGSGLKISPSYFGPYRVIKVKGNERYDVVKVGQHEGPNQTSTSADFMRPFVHYDSGTDDENDDLDELVAETQEEPDLNDTIQT